MQRGDEETVEGNDHVADEPVEDAIAEAVATDNEETETPDDADGGALQELAELQDRHLRLMAEFENFRKRTRREHAELRRMAQAELILRVLPTLDDMTRVASIPNDQTTVEALDEGILLIRRNLMKELEEVGLSRIDALDQPFDPELHQAVLRVTTDDPDLDNTVAQVFQEGYVLGERLVRPSQVEVRMYEEPTD